MMYMCKVHIMHNLRINLSLYHIKELLHPKNNSNDKDDGKIMTEVDAFRDATESDRIVLVFRRIHVVGIGACVTR